MTTRRLTSLQLILLVGLGAVFFIPTNVAMQPAAIDLALPEFVGDWKGVEEQASEGEKEILGPDTQFAKRRYQNGTDEISVSIVLSGPDMNTSIHRPERCLPAQGWTIANTRVVALPTDAGPLRMTRLHNSKTVRMENGQGAKINSINYYWFVGHSDMTPSHLKRTWIDVRDRLLKGSNQQWAYVTISALVTKDFKIFGRDDLQTDELVQKFITQLAPSLQKHPLSASR